MVKLIIDDKTVSVEEGTTILKAALANGIKIPNMCYDKRLRPYGGCRLCVVEVEGMPRLLAACSSPVAQGMIVTTDSPKLRKVRQTVLELLLIHHPLDCPVCDKAGECDLQDIAYEFGKPEGRFKRHRKAMPPDVRGPLIELTANRCILCGKCVRICSEHQGRGALGLIGRGFPTVVQPAFGEILECDYCGQCIDACPTGALLSKPFKFQARAWFLEEKDSICPFCGCGCTLTLGLREGAILRSRGKEDNGRSNGNLCGRGRFGFDYIYGESRLRNPLIRKDGALTPVTWDEALDYIASKLKAVIQTRGASAVGAIGSHRCTNEDNFMLRKFMTSVVGTENIDTTAAFGHAVVKSVVEEAFGPGAATADINAPLDRDLIFVVESDISITHPVFALNILQAKRDGASLITADSRESKLTRHSTAALSMKPGSAAAVINGIAKIILDKGLFDRQAASAAAGFAEFEKALAAYTTDKVSSASGVSAAELEAAAEAIAKAKKRIISLSVGVSENTKDAEAVKAACNLALLLGEDSGSIQIPAEYSNTVGAHRICGAGAGAKNIFDMLYGDAVDALMIMGEDPVSNFPDGARIAERLSSLGLLIVQDIALTETAKLAHAVLPASSWAEKEGTFVNMEGLEQKLPRVVSPTGKSMPDWQIIRNLSLAMGKEIGIRNIDAINEEIRVSIAAEASGEAKRRFFAPSGSTAAESSAEYPLMLVTRDILQHSGSMSTRSKSLDLVVSEAHIELNPRDAAACAVSDGGHIKIASKLGSIFLKARITDETPAGVVFAATNFPHGRVNSLVPCCREKSGPTPVKIEAVK